jgi:hypothetical protein
MVQKGALLRVRPERTSLSVHCPPHASSKTFQARFYFFGSAQSNLLDLTI